MSRNIPTVKTWRAIFTKNGERIGLATVHAPTRILARLELIHGCPSYWRLMVECDEFHLSLVRKPNMCG